MPHFHLILRLFLTLGLTCGLMTAGARGDDRPPLRADFDVVVYGATPSGIAAAIAAAQSGRSVALVEPTGLIGGMMTSGLSYTDFKSLESLGGFFRQYMRRVEKHYADTYGADSQQVKDCYFGVHAEPHVTLAIVREMLAEQPGITVLTAAPLARVETEWPRQGVSKITAVQFKTDADARRTLRGKVYIDATYEADLAAEGGALNRVGREGGRQYAERFAGKLFYRAGQILPGSTGEGDVAVQCYNFRITMTQREDIRAAVVMPAGYDRQQFAAVVEHVKAGRITTFFTEKGSGGIFRVQKIPNGKADINDCPGAPVRLSLPGETDEYPDGDEAMRRAIVERHRRYNLGLIYFCQHDEALPRKMRDEAATWGLCRDEFAEYGHFPPLIYVREARRVMGEELFTEHDALMGFRTIRSPSHPDAIAIGDYSLNCHGCRAAGPMHPGVTEGDFSYGTRPFQVPYGVIVPRGVMNLLVPVCVSATHIGYSCLRMEPTFVAMGEAAGVAAHLAIEQGCEPREVNIDSLQRMLHERGAKTIYVSDVEADSPLFRAVQYLGTRGALHRLYDPEKTVLPEVKHRYGLQYSYAMPLHELEPGKAMDEELARQWVELLPERVRGKAPAAAGMTRGEYLLKLYELVK